MEAYRVSAWLLTPWYCLGIIAVTGSSLLLRGRTLALVLEGEKRGVKGERRGDKGKEGSCLLREWLISATSPCCYSCFLPRIRAILKESHLKLYNMTEVDAAISVQN